MNISEEKDNVLTTKSKKLYVSTLNRADRVADVMLPVTGINATMTGIASETGYGRAIAIGAMADGSRKVVVIYTSGNVYVSEDDGVTFTYTASIGDYARDLTFCSGYFYAVKKAKLWKASINDLATWTRLADVPSGDGRRLTTTSGNVIYVGCDSKIYTLKNDVLTEVTALTNLATYAEYPAGIVQEENGLLFAYATYAQDTTKGLVIYESSDNGSTWTNVLLDTNNINGFAGIAYFKGQYVAINSEITTQTGYYNDYVSQDGITWKLADWKRSTCGYSD